MSTFTPGPWSLWGAANPSQVISYEHGFIAQTVGGNDEANARLIAAAPDLLENLIGCMESLASHAPDCVEVDCARAAIAKATGQ